MSTVRPVHPDDAEALLNLQHRLDLQSSFMLLEPGERGNSPEPLRSRLRATNATGSFDLVAESNGSLVGWVSVEVAPFRRARHTGYLVIGVDATASGQGLGTTLITAAAEEAQRRHLRRLELTVMSENLRALMMYLRCGFQIEGLRRSALERDGTVVDEYFMARLLT